MKLSDKIQVPELDELRVARLERAIVAELASAKPALRRSTSRALWKGGLALVAVAGVALAIGLQLRGAQEPSSASASRFEATEVQTGAGQSSRLTLGDAVVDVGADTSLTVQRYGDGRIVLQLEAGLVHCEVEPRENRPTFQVASGDVMVTVIGTGFDVERDRSVEVRVQHGIVGVETSYASIRLLAGEEWQGSPDAQRSLALLLSEAASDQQGVPEQELKASAQDAGSASEPAHNSKHGHNELKDAGTKKVAKTADKPLPPAVPLSEVLKGAKPLPPIFRNSLDPALVRLQEVSASNPKAAVKELEALAAKSTGGDASFALYSRAYLLFFKLHDNDAAITAATQYARRFPKGVEAEDMLWLRVRASCESSRSSECRAAAHTYLRNYPKGVFQGLCSRIITTTAN